jgi:hypothetical protein
MFLSMMIVCFFNNFKEFIKWVSFSVLNESALFKYVSALELRGLRHTALNS